MIITTTENQTYQTNQTNQPEKLSDPNLYRLCREYGKTVLHARRKFAGLLPEVHRREQLSRSRLVRKNEKSWLEKYGYSSIFEFAAKLAGMSEEQVRLVLNLSQRFSDKPELNKLLKHGEVSANKLVRIASVATPENDSELAKKARFLTQEALATMARDIKIAQKAENGDVSAYFDSSSGGSQIVFQNGLLERKQEALSVRAHLSEKDNSLDVKLLGKLSVELKQMLLNMDNKGLDINQILIDLLRERERKLQEEKVRIGIRIDRKSKSQKTNFSRHIPAHIRKIVKLEHGTICSIPHCNKPAVAIHHTRRFALVGNHDPRYLAPLCRGHHQIAHTIDKKFIQRLKPG